MKNYVGRFLNAAELNDEVLFDRVLDPFQKLRVLLIEVPKPAVAGFQGSAVAIEKEGQLIEQRFQSMSLTELTVLRGPDATFENFTTVIRKNFHIIHFCGYSKFTSAQQGAKAEGALVFHNGPRATRLIAEKYKGVRSKPLLWFINACDQDYAESGEGLFGYHGMDREILRTGAYLVANRWRVSNNAAGFFAKCFYEFLLDKRYSIGEAVYWARTTCKETCPDDLTWASYVFYGDPRINFPKG